MRIIRIRRQVTFMRKDQKLRPVAQKWPTWEFSRARVLMPNWSMFDLNGKFVCKDPDKRREQMNLCLYLMRLRCSCANTQLLSNQLWTGDATQPLRICLRTSEWADHPVIVCSLGCWRFQTLFWCSSQHLWKRCIHPSWRCVFFFCFVLFCQTTSSCKCNYRNQPNQ